MASHLARKSVLTVSLSRHLTGTPIREVVANDWKKAGAAAENFDNQGFDVDAQDFSSALHNLKKTLRGREWDGVLVGWCLRGNPDRTSMFEQVMEECVEESKHNPSMKIMFCTGPDNLVEAVTRNFPQSRV